MRRAVQHIRSIRSKFAASFVCALSEQSRDPTVCFHPDSTKDMEIGDTVNELNGDGDYPTNYVNRQNEDGERSASA